MTQNVKPNIQIDVDVTNPGQFFACCGLLELADRLWPGAEGWFEEDDRKFCIDCTGNLKDLLTAAKEVKYASCGDEIEEDKDDSKEDTKDDESKIHPVIIESPIILRLDWWKDKSLKTWAGSMNVHCIAAAMSNAIDPQSTDPFNQAEVVFDPVTPQIEGKKNKGKKEKKREPFYFDSRRAANSHSLDIGFSPNDLDLTSVAHPAVEFLCLIGLQRFRPQAAGNKEVFTYVDQERKKRLSEKTQAAGNKEVFTYAVWCNPLPVCVAGAAASGKLQLARINYYCFGLFHRTEYMKAFLPAQFYRRS